LKIEEKDTRLYFERASDFYIITLLKEQNQTKRGMTLQSLLSGYIFFLDFLSNNIGAYI